MKEQRKYLTEEELKRFLKGIESTREQGDFHRFLLARPACGRAGPAQIERLGPQSWASDIRNTDRYTHVSGRAQTAMYDRLKDRW